MTKLKTIKDLEKQDWSTHKGDMELVRAVFFEVKKEALKWMNEINKKTKEAYEKNEDGGHDDLKIFPSENDWSVANHGIVNDFIEHFCNFNDKEISKFIEK